MRFYLFYLLFFVAIGWGFAQNSISLKAHLNDSTHILTIQQELVYTNSSKDSLSHIYLNDWANAFSAKNTPLAKRFAEEFARRFRFAKAEERGATFINNITDAQNDSLKWERPEQAQDLVKINLDKALLPGQSIAVKLDYHVKIPIDKFTRYGVDSDNNYKLRYWYFTTGVYKDGKWQVYSHKNLGDQYNALHDVEIELSIPPKYYVASALKLNGVNTINGQKKVKLSGIDQLDSKLYLTKSFIFESLATKDYEVVTNVDDDELQPEIKSILLDRILKFYEQKLGAYPHKKIFVTRDDYLNSPIYGLNQLPGFIRPFPDGFQYDIKQFKTITNYMLENSIHINPRKEQWVHDAILVSLMIDYVNEYYPHMKLLGNLSDIIGVRWFHAADLEFNDQYQFLYMNMARMNLDQALSSAQDSLVKFNKNIANSYKAGIGLKYVEDFLGNEKVTKAVKDFYLQHNMQPTSSEDFQQILENYATKDISWFFKDYVNTNKKIDFSIEKLYKTQDSLRVTIRNKRKSNFPVSLYGLKNGEIVFKKWIENIDKTKTVEIARQDVDRLALNYEQKIPEFNQRDNYKAVTKLFNKPLQIRLLQDIEDPRYSQLFFMPEFNYNLYDGISIGPKLYNKTVLSKNFNFNISPKYGFNSETIVGSASITNRHQFANKELYAITYGIGGTRYSYGYNLFYQKYTPFINFSFRNKYLRDNERQNLLIRNVNVRRDMDPSRDLEEPNYNVFNINYRYSKPHLVDYYSASFDFQLAEKFSKISMSLEYRKLFKNNRQINLRFFTGTFLYSDAMETNYFSFALDRPTDYLFDYNYYGRSQGSGLFSQQIIVAEGGFKSQLQPEYANQWLTTLNASTNLYKWFFIYGDVGLVKNQHQNAKFLYDSGVRLSLVDDYFEIFFPVYSNLGWEVAQENYDQKIRFIVSLDINTLIKLFTRRWY
ncbi:metalloprotease [Salegentibacter maritimus]|uniref:metalloprotease n=1 Tax=Salegentibacter maritimus TaxID=2794347 RepID=UPI001E4B0C3F|nr:metalloprotease [Salegentibacter maritimus]